MAKEHKIQESIEVILKENQGLVPTLSNEAKENFIRSIQNAKAIFFAAQGRAGFILRCFCMRLMHLGFPVYFCGETITPAIADGDLLIIMSGSGETASTLEAVKSGKEHQASTYGILGNLDSKIAALVDNSIHIPGTTKLQRNNEPDSLQMAGSLFEQFAFFFLEAVVLELYLQRKKDIGSISSRHAVIE
ncbi:6-phospho-3-hexuloisomerase [Thermodesulfobacteriota bacterium]